MSCDCVAADADEKGESNLDFNSVCSRVSDDSGIEDIGDELLRPGDCNGQDKPDLLHIQLRPMEDDSEPCSNHPAMPSDFSVSDGCNASFPLTEDPKPLVLHCDTQGIEAKAGVCGLQNLGNTCYFNAGLQCLFATNQLRHTFLYFDLFSSDGTYDFQLLQRFHLLFRKVFSGKYLALCPEEFHTSLIRLHPQFGDFKQHDCQEFLSFLLNTLHEMLSKTATPVGQDSSLDSTSDTLKFDNECKKINDCCKRVRVDEIEADAGVVCEDNAPNAKKAWRMNEKRQESVIVEAFQGQFQSKVTCKKCECVSTTYEPFMQVSLSIPHAMEIQVVVTWVPSFARNFCNQESAKKCLVTVNKEGTLRDVKTELLNLLRQKDPYIMGGDIVLAEVHRAAYVRILDDRMLLKYLSKTKDLYAIEIVTLPSPTTACVSDAFQNLRHHEYGDLSTGNGSDMYGRSSDINDDMRASVTSGISLDVCDRVRHTGKAAASWHSCAICLEDTFDEELCIHPTCGGTLCKDCLKSTADFHSGQAFPCPVCNLSISTDDYQAFPDSSRQEHAAERSVLVPVLLRCHLPDTPHKYRMFGHPVMLSLHYELHSNEARSIGADIVSSFGRTLAYDVLLTDSSGLSCALCSALTCTGCVLEADHSLKIKPGSCITIHFQGDASHVQAEATVCRDDASMKLMRTGSCILLEECLEKFAECEILGAGSSWLCPECKSIRCAAKVMSVYRWPDVLLIHLKRFRFDSARASKVTCPVKFPLTGLSVDMLSCPESTTREPGLYDLYGCVCHTGSLYGGHYTSYTKHHASGKWYFFNDESVQERTPDTEDAYAQSYVLFYRRQGVAEH